MAFVVCFVFTTGFSLIGSIDFLAIAMSIMFLLMYTSINAGCLFNSLLDTPHWRPRFSYYHWTTALFGSLICIACAFLVSYIAAPILIVFTVGFAIYIFIRSDDNGSSAITGLQLQLAQMALLNVSRASLKQQLVTVQNWRPHVMMLCQSSLPT